MMPSKLRWHFLKYHSIIYKFNGHIYQQVDGVAMGSPLGPLFANIFMSFHEKSWLHNCPSSFKPLLYRRYVDDCFLLFRSLDYVPLFLSYLNRQHSNIFFSSELEKNGKLPFLDIEITRSNGKFSTSVYRKPTFTGLFTNFHSFVPLVYKRSLVCCLLHRMNTFMPNSKSLGNCSTLMVFPPTCSINLFATSSTISSNPNHLSSQFPRKSSIFAFLSPVHTPFRFALKSHVFAVRLTLTLTFALSFALLHASPLSFPLRIKFPSF